MDKSTISVGAFTTKNSTDTSYALRSRSGNVRTETRRALGSKFVITSSISVEIGSMKSEFPNSNNAPVIRVPMSFLKNTKLI